MCVDMCADMSAASVSCVVIQSGYKVLSGAVDMKLLQWDLNALKLVKTFTGHKGTVRCIQLLPSHNLIISGGEDKTIRIWDSGRLLSAKFH